MDYTIKMSYNQALKSKEKNLKGSGVTSGITQMGDGVVVESLDEVAIVTIGDIVGFQRRNH